MDAGNAIGQVRQWRRISRLCAGLASAVLVLAAVMQINAEASTLSITATPPLTPPFDPSITNYTAPCGTSTAAATTVTMSVTAPAGSTVAVDGTSPQTGTFSASVGRAWGQGFGFSITTGNAPPVAYHVRCLPSDMPSFTIQKSGVTQAQYYIIAVASPPPVVSYVVIVDANGVPVWWLKSDASLRPVFATLLSNGNIATTNSDPQNPQTSVNAQIHTLTGSLVATLNSPDHPPSDIHDIQLLSNGDYLLVAYPVTSGVDLSSIGGASDTCIIDGEVEEITPSGSLVWNWFASQHVSPTEINQNIQARAATSTCTSPQDIWHLNSVDDAGTDFIVSLRYTGVYRVNKATGNVLWKLGGTITAQSLAISGDSATPAGGLGQHDARLWSDGSVSFFDNGNDGNNNPASRAPRVVRYSINATAATATLVEDINDPLITTPVACCGSARRLPGGNWVIGWGSDNVETEVTPSGSRVFSLSGQFTYRMIPILPGVLSAAELQADMDAMNPVGAYWRTDAPPQAGSASQFNTMKALNPHDVWAAGAYVQSGVNWPFIDQWNGASWQRLVAPQAGSASQFNAISPLSDTDVWAAGSYLQGGVDWPFADHWTGSSWQVLTAPRAGSSSTFTSLTALSDTDVWAAGSYLQGGVSWPYVEHWTGTSWQVLVPPEGGTASQFTAMTAISDTDVWAAGFYMQAGANWPFVEHWNGTSWQVLAAPQGGSASQFTSMTVLSDTDLWTAGFYVQDGVNWPFVEQWDGSVWHVHVAPQAGSASQFNSVTALSDNDVWAAGSYVQGGADQAFADHWDGTSWQVLSGAQNGSASRFTSMTALTDTAVWAAGSYTQGSVDWAVLQTYGPGST